MKGKLAMLAGGAIGYVLGARAGRERYDQIMQSTSRLWSDSRLKGRMSHTPSDDGPASPDLGAESRGRM